MRHVAQRLFPHQKGEAAAQTTVKLLQIELSEIAPSKAIVEQWIARLPDDLVLDRFVPFGHVGIAPNEFQVYSKLPCSLVISGIRVEFDKGLSMRSEEEAMLSSGRNIFAIKTSAILPTS